MAVVGATDLGSTRLVYAMVAGLVIVGIAFVVLGIWLVRQTRVDPQVLAPLERMSDRTWQHKDSPTQRRLLDEVRPPGATPLRPEPAAPSVDAEFGSRRAPESLSDLGPGVVEPTPSEIPLPEGSIAEADFTVDADGEVEATSDAATEADTDADLDTEDADPALIDNEPVASEVDGDIETMGDDDDVSEISVEGAR